MVEDSIMKRFSSSKATVVGIDVWNSSAALIDTFITRTGVTYPIAMNGAAVASAYTIVANSMVVIDQNGVVQYVKQLGTASTTYSIMLGMVSEAAAKTRDLLAAGISRFSSAIRPNAIKKGNEHLFTLCGRKVSDRQKVFGVLVKPEGKNGRIPQLRL